MEYDKDKMIMKQSMEFAFEQFWNSIEVAAESKDKSEIDVAIGLILEGILYMKQAGMSEDELIKHIKTHYNDYDIDLEGNIIEKDK